MFPTNGSENVGVTAVGGEKLTGGVHGIACTGGGAEIAGGGIHVGLTCAGGECAEIAVAAVDEVAKGEDAAGAGCAASRSARRLRLANWRVCMIQ